MTTGIKETKELLKFIIDFGMAVDQAMADKKFDMSELGLLIAPLMQIGPAFTGIDKLGGELKDLDAAESADLVAYFSKELDLANDKVEVLIEQGLALGLQIYSFTQLFKK